MPKFNLAANLDNHEYRDNNYLSSFHSAIAFENFANSITGVSDLGFFAEEEPKMTKKHKKSKK